MENINHEIVCESMKYGVRISYIFPEQNVVNAACLEDAQEMFIYGTNTEQPTLSFDFTEHDSKIRADMAMQIFGGRND